MPTENDARILLAKAAATIDVDDDGPMTLAGLPEPRVRRWPVLVAAAAAVVVAIGGGYLVARQVGDEQPAGGGGPAPVASDSPPARTLDPDQLPDLIGYTDDEAIALLEQRGYAVQVHLRPDGCDVPGIVTGTDPAVGTRMRRGDPVTLRVVGRQQVVDCVGEVPWHLVWDIVRTARGLEGTPASLAAARLPEGVLATLDEQLSQEWDGLVPHLVARWGYDTGWCGAGNDASGGDLQFWIEVPIDGVFCPQAIFAVEIGPGGVVRSVRVVRPDTSDDPVEPSAARQDAADAFIAWARGDGPAPQFADRVRVMYGGGPAFGSTGWTDRPEDRSTYSGCSGLGFPDCGVDPVGLLVRHDGPAAVAAGRSICADGGEVPQRFADAADDVVRIEEPEPANCLSAWAVELWIDADGVIYGVNQAGG